jgi:hypothetical protein
MNKSTFFTGQPVFNQLIKLIPRSRFKHIANELGTDRYYKKFDSWHHLLTMLFSTYVKCNSLRELTSGLRANEGKLQSLGFTHFPARSTLSDANKNRNWRVFERLYYDLYDRYASFLPDSRCRKSYMRKLVIIDSTSISLFKEILKNAGRPAADGRRKGGIKVHAASKANENIPYLIRLTSAATTDKILLKHLFLPKGSVVVFDLGYVNYVVYNQWTKEGVYWVTKLYPRSVVQILKEMPISEYHRSKGIISDQRVRLGHPAGHIEKVDCRLITYKDPLSGKIFRFITNHLTWSPLTIAGIYKKRWQIELLFKRIKQNFLAKYFLGDNENAIRIQILCMLIADLLLIVFTKGLSRRWSFSNLASMIRIHIMSYTNLVEFLNNPDKAHITSDNQRKISGQLALFPT